MVFYTFGSLKSECLIALAIASHGFNSQGIYELMKSIPWWMHCHLNLNQCPLLSFVRNRLDIKQNISICILPKEYNLESWNHCRSQTKSQTLHYDIFNLSKQHKCTKKASLGHNHYKIITNTNLGQQPREVNQL